MNDSDRASDVQRHEQFRATLGRRRQLIAERWMELRMMRWSRTGADQMRAMVRELADQATSFGYTALGELARELQHRIEAVLGDYSPFKELIGGITASVERVNLQVDRVLNAGSAERSTVAVAAAPVAAEPFSASKPVVLIADADPHTCTLLQFVLAARGFDSQSVNAAEPLLTQLAQQPPALLLIDEALLLQLGNALDPRVGDSRGRFGDTPWIVLSWLPDIDLRLRALNAGASACLAKPLLVEELEAAIALACLPLSSRPLNVQVIADTPELAERHAESLRETGLIPLLGAQLANLPDVLAAHAADVLLLDMNLDPRQRDVWLSLLADTPGFDCLPVICLNTQRSNPACRHRRTTFLAAPIAKKLLAHSLRRAVLENDLDSTRVLRLTDIERHRHSCTLDVFMTRLADAVARAGAGATAPALGAIELDSALSLLRDHGSRALLDAQRQLEERLRQLLDDADCCTRLGSSGVLALLSSVDADALQQLLARAATAPPSTTCPDLPALTCNAVGLPLQSGIVSARDALARCEAALAEARQSGGNCQQVVVAAVTAPVPPAAPMPSALPVERMRLQVKPLEDAAGTALPLHDCCIVLQGDDGSRQPIADLMAEVVANGLATQLDVWEMNAAAAELVALPDAIRGIEIAMRLSTASRKSVMLVPVVRSVVSKLPPDRGFRLVFEVAESWLVNQNAAAVEMVEALRGLGCGVMLGDFGGTDNPRNLAWASWFDYARLSQRCIEQLTDSDESRQRVEKLLRTASSRSARIIARAKNRKSRATLSEWGVTLFEPL